LTKYLKEDDDKVRSEEGIRAHEQWREQRASIRETAAKPEWTVLTATSYATTLGVHEERCVDDKEPKIEQAKRLLLPEVAVETIAIDFSRPHGKRFGTLVHAVLSVVSLDSDRDAIGKIAQVQGRILGATEEEVAAAVETVQRALEHPVLNRAAAARNSGQCRREVPVALRLDDGSIVEGVVDLAFQEATPDGPWAIVDYKTDFEVKGRLEEYRKQVKLYGLAISLSTGQQAQGILLRI
jgi:ATP-dependent exoDNAse (exonuclease V) beta subunit